MANVSTVDKAVEPGRLGFRNWQVTILSLLGVVLLAILLVNVVLWTSADQETQATMRLELFKSLLALAMVAIIGNGVVAIYNAIERSIETARLRSQARSDFLLRLGRTYRQVKEVRRMLRAGGVAGKGAGSSDELSATQLAVYDAQMPILNRAQLDLEALKIEARTLPDVITIDGLDEHLSTMEKYLGDIISEWESSRPQGSVRGSDLPRLSEFARKKDKMDADGNRQFSLRFTTPHNLATMLVATNLQPPRRFTVR